MPDLKKIAVIGGGISGMACVQRLFELKGTGDLPIEVTLFEAGSHLGGVIGTEIVDRFLLEKGPDAFITEKPAALKLCERLGLSKELIGTRDENRKSFILRGGILREVPEGFYLVAPMNFGAFLKSDVCSWRAKLRMGFEPLVPAKKDDQDESIASFVRRRLGDRALVEIGQPMLGGIYAGDPETLSVQATFPKFREYEKRHGSLARGFHKTRSEVQSLQSARGPRYSLFVSLKSGMDTLVHAMFQKWPRGTVRFHSPVRDLLFDARDRKWRLVQSSGEIRVFDAVVAAVPAHVSAAMLEKSSAALSELLKKIRYESSATIHYAFWREDLGALPQGFGFVVPKTEGLSMIGCTFCDQKFEGRAPQNATLLRAFVGGKQAAYTSIEEKVLAELRTILKIKTEPIFSRVFRHPDSMVQYGVGHRVLVKEIKDKSKEYPGLFLTGAAFKGIGIPDCIADAEERAESVKTLLFPQVR